MINHFSYFIRSLLLTFHVFFGMEFQLRQECPLGLLCGVLRAPWELRPGSDYELDITTSAFIGSQLCAGLTVAWHSAYYCTILTNVSTLAYRAYRAKRVAKRPTRFSGTEIAPRTVGNHIPQGVTGQNEHTIHRPRGYFRAVYAGSGTILLRFVERCHAELCVEVSDVLTSEGSRRGSGGT